MRMLFYTQLGQLRHIWISELAIINLIDRVPPVRCQAWSKLKVIYCQVESEKIWIQMLFFFLFFFTVNM